MIIRRVGAKMIGDKLERLVEQDAPV